MSENIIERYLRDIGGIHNTGAHVAETSFYPALERLLTDIGSTLTPKVRCVINLKNSGGGIPDGGLFTADQFRHHGSEQFVAGDFLKSQPPARGVIEAKAPHEDVNAVAATEQVRRYWEHYRVVLVTNFRAFVLIGSNPAGQPCMLEAFSLADSADEFWHLVGHPRKAAAEQGERLLEYLKRVLLCNAPLARPEDVAAILASYAHDARLRIQNTELPALQSLRDALEQALGLHFEGERGHDDSLPTLLGHKQTRRAPRQSRRRRFRRPIRRGQPQQSQPLELPTFRCRRRLPGLAKTDGPLRRTAFQWSH